MQDQDRDQPSLAEIVAYRQGQRAGFSLAALAIAAMAFVNLLGFEKSLLALVIAGIALRGGVVDPRTRHWARLAIALAVGHWLVLTVVMGLYHQQLAQLIALLQRLS
ncbi:MAG: hypothetical protein JWM65_3521 [Sphingomonas bacterium]|nr:hypothetical protein [Sphingomonas bacterium]